MLNDTHHMLTFNYGKPQNFLFLFSFVYYYSLICFLIRNIHMQRAAQVPYLLSTCKHYQLIFYLIWYLHVESKLRTCALLCYFVQSLYLRICNIKQYIIKTKYALLHLSRTNTNPMYTLVSEVRGAFGK